MTRVTVTLVFFISGSPGAGFVVSGGEGEIGGVTIGGPRLCRLLLCQVITRSVQSGQAGCTHTKRDEAAGAGGQIPEYWFGGAW
jgi:hypothetical protein